MVQHTPGQPCGRHKPSGVNMRRSAVKQLTADCHIGLRGQAAAPGMTPLTMRAKAHNYKMHSTKQTALRRSQQG